MLPLHFLVRTEHALCRVYYQKHQLGYWSVVDGSMAEDVNCQNQMIRPIDKVLSAVKVSSQITTTSPTWRLHCCI